MTSFSPYRTGKQFQQTALVSMEQVWSIGKAKSMYLEAQLTDVEARPKTGHCDPGQPVLGTLVRSTTFMQTWLRLHTDPQTPLRLLCRFLQATDESLKEAEGLKMGTLDCNYRCQKLLMVFPGSPACPCLSQGAPGSNVSPPDGRWEPTVAQMSLLHLAPSQFLQKWSPGREREPVSSIGFSGLRYSDWVPLCWSLLEFFSPWWALNLTLGYNKQQLPLKQLNQRGLVDWFS